MPSMVPEGFPFSVRLLPVMTKFPRHVPSMRIVLPDGTALISPWRSPPVEQFTVGAAHADGAPATQIAASARISSAGIEPEAMERGRVLISGPPWPGNQGERSSCSTGVCIPASGALREITCGANDGLPAKPVSRKLHGSETGVLLSGREGSVVVPVAHRVPAHEAVLASASERSVKGARIRFAS